MLSGHKDFGMFLIKSIGNERLASVSILDTRLRRQTKETHEQMWKEKDVDAFHGKIVAC